MARNLIIDRSQDRHFMAEALALAEAGAALGEVPVGALLVQDGEVIGRGFNCPISTHDPSAHAEMVAIRDAAKVWSSGVAFCAGITTLDALGACWDVEGIGFSDGDPDATSYPIPGTLAPVSWQADTAQVLIAPAPPEGLGGGSIALSVPVKFSR